MTTKTINQIIERLSECRPLSPERFAELLAVGMTPGAHNPYWMFFSFKLSDGAFVGGELRISAGGDRALMSLKPRDPPGLTASDVDKSTLGKRLGIVPNPHIPPEGADTESFAHEGVEIGLQWTHASRRLRSVVLKWEPRASPVPPPAT